MNKSHYSNHNKSILNAVAGDKHAAWIRARAKAKLKKAKNQKVPMLGLTLHSLQALSTL